jgi:hypothetical protein
MEVELMAVVVTVEEDSALWTTTSGRGGSEGPKLLEKCIDVTHPIIINLSA